MPLLGNSLGGLIDGLVSGGGGGTLWTPANLPTAPYFWGRTTSTSKVANIVTAINHVGGANHLTVPANVGSPTQSGAGPIVFNGTNSLLLQSTTVEINNIWVFLLFKRDPTSTGLGYILNSGVSIRRDSSTAYRIEAGSIIASGFPANDNETLLISAKADNFLGSVFKNGAQVGSEVSISTTPTTRIRLGGLYSTGSSTGSNYGGMELYEFIAVAGSLTQADQQKIEGYMCHNNNLESLLDAGHPYRNNPPEV